MNQAFNVLMQYLLHISCLCLRDTTDKVNCTFKAVLLVAVWPSVLFLSVRMRRPVEWENAEIYSRWGDIEADRKYIFDKMQQGSMGEQMWETWPC